MIRMVSALALGAALAALTSPTLAQPYSHSRGDWTLGIGIANVNPKSDNGTLADAAAIIDDNTALTFTAEYFIRDNIGIELLAASPFEHDISLNGAYTATTKHLPPTLSVNYHFPTQTRFKPFVGVGINYTTFFEESSPAGVISLDDSVGLALNLGADWQISDRGALRVNVRYMDIETDVTLNGTTIGTAEIDPVTVGFGYVHRF
ncbi:OmpW/AlkL family protein [Phaeobacter sp. C3_T13_0]|uniref:OmpW/AlkL family protein n=1 Tax=Phaeobacter cretensis TaxID=3342641 RepID=UPI0039BC4935